MSKPGSIGAVAPVVPRTHLRSRGEGGAMTFRAVASAAGLVLLSAAAAQAGSVQVEGGAILGAMGSDGAVTHYLGVPFAAAGTTIPAVSRTAWPPPTVSPELARRLATNRPGSAVRCS